MRASRAFAMLLAALFCALGSARDREADVLQTYRQLQAAVSHQRISETYQQISRFGSRLAGSKGAFETLRYAEAELRKLGFVNIRREPFQVTIPDPDAAGSLGGQGWSAEVFPLWPNLVRTSTCDVTGALIYGGDGSLEDLKGKEIAGSVVLLEFSGGSNWRNAAKLGAAAIVFIEPESAGRSDAEAKFSATPLSIPRFYLPLERVAPALKAAFNGERVTLKCRQNWKSIETYNLIAELPGMDPKLAGELVTLLAYVDGMSVVPRLAPGAEASGSLVAALELARNVQSQRRARPLRIVVSDGHFLSLKGARAYVERRLEDGEESFLNLTLDLDSGAGTLGVFGRGWFYEYRNESQERLASVARTFRAHADAFGPLMDVPLPLVDAVNQSDTRTWKNNIPAKFAFDCEPMVQASLNAYTLATTQSVRHHWDTPFDTVEKVNVGNVRRQVQTLSFLLHHSLNDTADRSEPSRFKIPTEPVSAKARSLVGGFSTVEGKVAIYDPAKSFVPDVAVPDSLVVFSHLIKSLTGVRTDMAELTQGEEARYRLIGLPPISSYPQIQQYPIKLSAFHLNEETGDIDYAPSLGAFGSQSYPPIFRLTQAYKSTPIIVFPCRSLDLYDMVDPQDLKVFFDSRVLEARTNAAPREYGLHWSFWDLRMNTEPESAFVVFAPPGERLKFLMGTEFGEIRMILTHATAESPEGIGYLFPGSDEETRGRDAAVATGVLEHTALQVARDYQLLNASRIAGFDRYRIVSAGIRQLHDQANEELRLAEKALVEKDWPALERHSRAAWALALRVHPVVQGTANDVVKGVLFYLFLLIPFSYFLERLFFASRELTRQLAWSGAFFIASFLLLRAIHPAFEIVSNPTMIFVGFVMGALSLIVITFITGKFESSLKTIRQAESGIHEVDIGRVSVAMAAFNLGVSNMRRRKARTFLTTLTLVVMTFIVLSFTSIVPELQLNETGSDTEARYTGMLLRMPGLEQMQNSIYRALSEEFGDQAAVARRVWHYGADIGDTAVLTLRRADLTFNARALMGMEAAESRISRPQEALLPGGRWFEPGDEHVMILPRQIAETLKINPAELGRAKLRFAGEDYTIIGIIDSGSLGSIVDLDNDELLPADFTLSRQLQMEENTGNEAFREFIRLDPQTVVLTTAQDAIRLGGEIRSVAVGFQDAEATREALTTYMPRLRLNMYASVPGEDGLEVKQFSVLQKSSGSGIGLVLIQILIASVFVFNTMVASVYERTKEISIFSAIGLAPNHVSMLFFAESLVYGVLGSVSGYIVAQTVAKVIVATGALPGLYLNFSSISAVMAAGLVMGVVILSTIYPARIAARIAAPALNEDAFKTEPDGDEWRIELPFNVAASEAAPLVEFFGEWFAAYENYTIGDFVTSESRLYGQDGAYTAETVAWLAPYDLSVSQRVRLVAAPTKIPGVYGLHLLLTRLGGEHDNWITVNRRFLSSLRKQFLTWRTLDEDVRAAYVDRAGATFGLGMLKLSEA